MFRARVVDAIAIFQYPTKCLKNTRVRVTNLDPTVFLELKYNGKNKFSKNRCPLDQTKTKNNKTELIQFNLSDSAYTQEDYCSSFVLLNNGFKIYFNQSGECACVRV